jgi:pentatricopeptide repeat protein
MLWVGIQPDVYLGFESYVDVVNALITMYVKSGDVQSARLVFNRMPRRDKILWNAIISGYFETVWSRCFSV